MKKCILFPLILLMQFNLTLSAQQNQLESLSNVNCIPVTFDSLYNPSLSSTGSWPNQLTCFSSGSVFGGEVIFTLTAPCTNTYFFEVSFQNTLNDCYVGWRISTGNCLQDSFACLNPINTITNGTQIKRIFELQATENMVYDIFVVRDFYLGGPAYSNVQCKFLRPSIDVSMHDITPDSISFSWDGSFNDVILEYGPDGFTPGNDTSAGSLGTVISGITSPFKLAGLYNDSIYNFFFRSRCGNIFGSNTPVFRTRIPQPDSLIGQINGCLNSEFSATIYGSNFYHPGSWVLTNCSSSCRMSSPEILKKFTPDSSGYHILSKTSTAGSTSTEFTFYYKVDSLGLDEHNWQCIGPSGGNLPYSQSFGPLDANTSYYILIKNGQSFLNNCYSLNGVTGNVGFKIDCPGTCPIISNLTYFLNSVTTNSLTLWMRQGSTFGYFLIEYGPAGFTPGTDSLPGGGTIIPVTSLYSSIPISGLQPGTTYDFYLRQYCDVIGSFSANSTVISGTTLPICSISPTGITSNTPGDSVCSGEYVKLTQNGGLLSQSGSFVWYKDSCDSTPIGTGNYIYVAPDSSGYYFVKAVDTCIVTSCVPIFLTVNPLPQVSLLNPSLQEICLGDTVVLSATINSGWQYDWLRNGVSLNTANQPTYMTTNNGLYSVQVTDTNLCTNISQNSRVKIICMPPQNPIERMLIDEEKLVKNYVVIPNPGNGVFTCVFKIDEQDINFSVFDSFGKKVKSFVGNGRLGYTTFDLSNFSSGIYYLVAESANEIFKQKIVLIQR